MIDWLRKEQQDPHIEIGGKALPITIRRNARAKRLTMRLAPDGSEVRITLPQWGRTIDAITFAEARREWLAAQLAKLPAALVVGDGSAVPFRGGKLTVCWQESGQRKVLRQGSELRVGGPQDRIAARVKRWLESEALAVLSDDLGFYCERGGLATPELRLSRAQRRWGSCSSNLRKTSCIRINWRLVMAPDYVRRSVVAHEVAHLVHFDHSPAFHRLLGTLFDESIDEADRWLRQHGRELYAAFA